MEDIKLSEWIKDIDKRIASPIMPIEKNILISLKKDIIKNVKQNGFSYDITGNKVIKNIYYEINKKLGLYGE